MALLELGTSVFSTFVDYTIAPVVRHFGYVFNYKSNIKKLDTEVKTLGGMQTSVQHEVEDGARNGEEIEALAETWLKNVQVTTDNGKIIIAEGEERSQVRCFKGLCPNFVSRYQLGKKAQRMMEEASKLQKTKNEMGRCTFRPAVQGIGSTFLYGYEHFESRKRTFDGVMEALGDSKVNMVGLYGMGGVGKTTLVKQVVEKAKKENLFDTVVMVEITHNPDIKEIQGVIADKLGLKFSEESIQGRADRLCDRLRNEKRILLILDNMWEKLDLEAVGIPFGAESKGFSSGVEMHMGKEKSFICKIVITTRDRDVLTLMDAHKLFSVGILNEDESLDLFKKKAGDIVDNPVFKPTAVKVVQKCAGLPIAIVTVSSALKEKRLAVWKSALRELEKPSSAVNSRGVANEPYKAIELSYNYLSHKEEQQVFLLCGLFSFSFTSYLLRCCLGLGLLEGISTLEEARDKVDALVDKLQSCCLLVESSSTKEFTMHDLVRDVAVSIASRDGCAYASTNEVIERWPNAHTLKNCTHISLPNNDIRGELPDELQCPKLKFFHLGTKDPSLKIPDNFFTAMTELGVLSLAGMHMSSLPPSCNHLSNLRTLCLHECMLQDIALIGGLKTLEILTLRMSELKQLPMEIGQLTQLQCFDLSYCFELKVIPHGVLSRLTRLEELYMKNSFEDWEEEGSTNEASNATLMELKNLSRLTTLEIRVKDAKLIPNDLLFEKLRRYEILVGTSWDWPSKYDNSTIFKFKDWWNYKLDNRFTTLFKTTNELYFDELCGVISYVSCDLNMEYFSHLLHLEVLNSPDIRFIMDPFGKSFPKLKSLVLDGLMNLENICEGPLREESFSNLRELKVVNCGRLRHLFQLSSTKCLSQLEEITIVDCESMTKVFVEEATQKLELNKLRSLRLQNLPKLVSFLYDERLPTTSESRTPLFSHKTSFPALEELTLSRINLRKIWEENHPTMASSFQNVGSLELEGCDYIEYVLSSSMARSLGQLKHLEIYNCVKLQEIILVETMTDEEYEISFPLLTLLLITNLPSLTRFCSAKSMTFSSLKRLEIYYCPEFMGFVSISESQDNALIDSNSDESNTHTLFNEKVLFPMLEELTLSNLKKLRNIWSNQLKRESVSKLVSIHVAGCSNPSSVFPATLATSFVHLENLLIAFCEGVEYIFAKDEKAEATTVKEFLFPRLSVLYLWSLPKLIGLYPGLHTSEWTMLKELKIDHCDKIKVFTPISQGTQGDQLNIPTQQPFFIVEKVFSTLERLTLNSEDIEMFNLHGDLPPDLFFKIRDLTLGNFHDVSAVIPLIFLKRFQNLETLRISESYFQELLPPYEALGGEEEHAVIFTRITKLILDNLSSFRHIWKKDDPREPVLQNLESLQVESCHSLINLAPSLSYLQNLTYLDVMDCQELINVVPSCAGKILVNLNTLKITLCYKVTSIISKNEGQEAEEGEIVFSNLVYLELDGLPGLLSFCSSNHNFMFPRLVKVVINQCPKIETFAHGVVTTPLLHKVWMTEEMDVGRWEENLNTTVKQMFAKMDGLRTLEYVNLNDFPRLVELWHDDAQRVLDFKNLEVLTFDNCSSLRFIFTESMAVNLVQLQQLEVKNCIMMEEILRRGKGDEQAEWNMIKFPRLEILFLESCCQLTCFSSGHNTQLEFPSLKTITVKKCPDMKTFVEAIDDGNVETHQWPFFSEKVLFPVLEEVTISNLENVGNIWPNQLNANAISKLRSIKVEGCSNLSSVFPATLAKSLLQLEELDILSCGVEYIFAKDEKSEATTVTEFLFPKLSYLQLWMLPKLRGLYPGLHTSEWTMLKDLNIYHCDKIQIYAPHPMISQGTKGGNNPTQQPLFNVEKDFSTLEELALNSEDIKMINLHCQFPEELFFKLRTLNVQCFHDLSAVIPLSFLQRFHNLETLIINCSSFRELLPPCEAREGGEEHIVIFTRITKLVLNNLSSLTHLCKEDYPWEHVLQNLEHLQVWKCPSLITLAPSSAYLQNLTYLDVWQCHGLINIMSSSTANSLVNLDTLKIRECDKVAQIISNNEGCETEEEEIIFNKLEYLELDRLSGLLSFCSANNKLTFPCLVEVVINQCPKMETFVQGVVSTPLLDRVMMMDVNCWKGDLNTTVKQNVCKNGLTK